MLSVAALIGHKEWAPTRKIDPRYSMDWRRGQVAAFTPGWDDMADLTDANLNAIADRVWQKVQRFDSPGSSWWEDHPPVWVLSANFYRVSDLFQAYVAGEFDDDVDEQVIADRLGPMLVSAITGTVRTISDADLDAMKSAVNDEADRRARDQDPTTGPRS